MSVFLPSVISSPKLSKEPWEKLKNSKGIFVPELSCKEEYPNIFVTKIEIKYYRFKKKKTINSNKRNV